MNAGKLIASAPLLSSDGKTLLLKKTGSLDHPSLSRANAQRFAFIERQASSTAIPFKSAPEEAAVGDALGTLSVRVEVLRITPTSTPNSLATMPFILV